MSTRVHADRLVMPHHEWYGMLYLQVGMSEIYHVWFATRRRKWLLQGEVEERALALIREIAVECGIELLASEAMTDHVHLLLRLGADQDLSSCIHRLKGTSARRLFEEIPELKLDIGMEHFWQKRYGSKLVQPGAVQTVRRYKRRGGAQCPRVLA